VPSKDSFVKTCLAFVGFQLFHIWVISSPSSRPCVSIMEVKEKSRHTFADEGISTVLEWVERRRLPCLDKTKPVAERDRNKVVTC
jgi:hypothetical protein